MNLHFRLLLQCLGFLFLVSLFIGLASCVSAPMSPTPVPPPLGTHQVVSSSIPLVEIWRYRAGYAESSQLQFNPPPLIVAENKVIISTYVDANDRAHSDSILTARALDSGQILWQTPFSKVDRYGGTSIRFSYFDEKLNHLYLESPFRIMAFDTETGKQLWVTPNLGDHARYVFAHEQQDGVLTVRANRIDQEQLTFDPNDGRLLSREKTQYFLSVMTPEGQEIPIPQNTEFKWDFECYAPVIWPTFVGTEDLLLECSSPFYALYRANYKTGQTVWRTPWQFISNYAIRGNTLYVLDASAEMQAIDIETGNFLGMMTFNGEMTDTAHIRPFWIAIQDPYLVIYFGDTQELVAFRMNTP